MLAQSAVCLNFYFILGILSYKLSHLSINCKSICYQPKHLLSPPFVQIIWIIEMPDFLSFYIQNELGASFLVNFGNQHYNTLYTFFAVLSS